MLDSLTELVALNYAIDAPALSSIHLFEHPERGVYKVERTDGPPLLLRACRTDTAMAERLTGTAGALDALASVGYPAPGVQHTHDGTILAKDGEWSGLLLTFVEGALATSSSNDMQEMGKMLAQLHLLDIDQLRTLEPRIPYCRWHPKSKMEPWLTELEAVADLVPPDLESRYHFCVDAVTNVLKWPDLPLTLLHTDCNPQNAVRQPDGQMTFIDWDGIGVGPAILDLGYLLFYSHILQESWPTIEPDRAWIGAVLQGYLPHRRLSERELEHLSEAIALVECHHLARGLPDAVRGDWKEHRGLTRFYDREKIVPVVAEMSLDYLNRNIASAVTNQ